MRPIRRLDDLRRHHILPTGPTSAWRTAAGATSPLPRDAMRVVTNSYATATVRNGGVTVQKARGAADAGQERGQPVSRPDWLPHLRYA